MSEINTSIHLGLRKNTSASTCNTPNTLYDFYSKDQAAKHLLLKVSFVLIEHFSQKWKFTFSPIQHLTVVSFL